jgi:hypothetical protein
MAPQATEAGGLAALKHTGHGSWSEERRARLPRLPNARLRLRPFNPDCEHAMKILMTLTSLSLAAAALVNAPCALAADEPWMVEARTVAAAVPPKLLQVLTEAIAKSGPAEAVTVCQDSAPKMARAASEQSGWQIRRVSLRNRNPKAVPDAWERETLEDFDRLTAAGAAPASLERTLVQTVDGKPVQRYMRALPTQGLCLGCHGAAEGLAPGVAERLKTLYPDDKAVGYSLGQIRGAITLKRAP